MLLYHGSNQVVRKPQLLPEQRRLDFGPGFYLTSDLEQACHWATLKTGRLQTGKAMVSIYVVDDTIYSGLSKLMFQKADAAWLQYVAANRSASAKHDAYDVVIGPVANDRTMPTIARFLAGDYSVAETLRRLKSQKLKNQYAFRTEHSLEALIYQESQEL